ncbi:MAG TPA: helix-turn-helix domain-containing protein [Bryobacteraceae bacterium]|nr:helix-turn-helix domain-containing protein [Bryobacteraceae bacterium]
MKDTGTAGTEREALHSQIEKLNRSEVLHGSESLCKLLRYLGEHSLDSPGTPLKEYQIATEVFGRPPDFDSRVDSTVRVQTGRLRSKLAEYYAGEGALDRLVIEIPKGAYSLTYHARPPVEVPAVPAAAPAPPVEPIRPNRPFPPSWFFLSILLGAALVVVISIAVTRFMMPAQPAGEQPAPVVRTFWSGFANPQEAALVVYSNAEFVGRPETGLRYFNPSLDGGKAILDHYTGVGEVMAVHELDRVFASLQQGIRIKRGRLLTWDDAKTSDLIFIGSPSENLSLRELPGTQDFVFARKPAAPRKGDLLISNLHPGASEPAAFLASEPPITEDYALVTLTSGLNPNRRVLILAGITTFGTQAAVEFVCRAARLDELTAKLGPGARRHVPPFEALLRVKVSGGVPVSSELLSVHPHARGSESRN